MGTKNNPGKYDCYAKAGPNEPMFVLLARDPIAPFLVSIWGSVRNGDLKAAETKFRILTARVLPQYYAAPEPDKASEAVDCAFAMFNYTKQTGKGG